MAEADAPKVGQIVDHYFLWADEHIVGHTEGRKPRPCLVISVEPHPHSTRPRVTLLPITSRVPHAESSALAVPDGVKATMGLAPARDAWVVLDDANTFVWPGFDLVPQRDGGFVRGVAPRRFFRQVSEAVAAAHARRPLRRVSRD